MSAIKPEDLKKAYRKEGDSRVIKRMAAVNMVCMNGRSVQETADELEAEAGILLEIPEDRYAKMLEVKDTIIKMYEIRGDIVDYAFIDRYEESIQIVLKSDLFEEHKVDVKASAEAVADSKSMLFDIGGVKIGVNHFIPSTVASDTMCGDRTANQHICATGTIAFPATRTYLDSGGGSVTDAGFIWSSTAYSRDDATAGKAFDAEIPVADDPEPGSTHTMRLGLVPTS